MSAEEHLPKVVRTKRYRLTTLDFPAELSDPFFNANCAEDLAQAEQLLARTEGQN